MCRLRQFSTLVLTSSTNQEATVPLYLEILDKDSSVTEPAIRGAADAGVVESWTSTITGEQVRLVDGPEARVAPSESVRVARILFY
jgi:hypothetical protein